MKGSALSIKPQVFAILSALIEERSGLHYELADADVIADRLCTRALEAGFDSLLDYYYFLRYDEAGSAELDALVDALVVHETYFFRELEGLTRLVSDVVAPLVAAGKRPRLWFAACATGEEPLTAAMLLADRGLLAAVDLVASDVSARALARARAGDHGPRSLRDGPRVRLASSWVEVVDGKVTVREELRRAIDWRRVNLVEPRAVAALGLFDAIVCRNVLIYFSDATTRRVLEHLSAALVPSGVLLVGVSESLLRFGTLLSCEERGGSFFYRKGA